MCTAKGLNERYQFVVVLDLDGQFLQFRTINYLHCRSDNPNLLAVLRVLADLDYQIRFVKYGWDATDGEIVAYGDVWVVDGTLTQQQFGRNLANYLSAIDLNHPRVAKAIADGQDVGTQGPVGLPPGVPDDVREKLARLLEELRRKAGGAPAEDKDGPVAL